MHRALSALIPLSVLEKLQTEVHKLIGPVLAKIKDKAVDKVLGKTFRYRWEEAPPRSDEAGLVRSSDLSRALDHCR